MQQKGMTMEVTSSTEQKVLYLTAEDLFTVAGKNKINAEEGWHAVAAKLYDKANWGIDHGLLITFRRDTETD